MPQAHSAAAAKRHSRKAPQAPSTAGAKRRKLGKSWLGEAGLYITLVVDDFEALMTELLERSAPFLDDINELPNGKRVTGLADPDGVLIEIREA